VKRAALVLLVVAGCTHRKPIKVVTDGGPAVEVVEADKRAPDRPKLPLVDEKEADDDVAHAQPIPAGSGIRGNIGKAGDVDVYSWMDPGGPKDMGGFDYARVELSGVAGLDLALDVLDGDGKRLMSVNDGAAGEPEIIPNVGVDPAHTYYLRVREATGKASDATRPY
jgi:hypothetical protein